MINNIKKAYFADVYFGSKIENIRRYEKIIIM